MKTKLKGEIHLIEEKYRDYIIVADQESVYKLEQSGDITPMFNCKNIRDKVYDDYYITSSGYVVNLWEDKEPCILYNYKHWRGEIHNELYEEKKDVDFCFTDGKRLYRLKNTRGDIEVRLINNSEFEGRWIKDSCNDEEFYNPFLNFNFSEDDDFDSFLLDAVADSLKKYDKKNESVTNIYSSDKLTKIFGELGGDYTTRFRYCKLYDKNVYSICNNKIVALDLEKGKAQVVYEGESPYDFLVNEKYIVVFTGERKLLITSLETHEIIDTISLKGDMLKEIAWINGSSFAMLTYEKLLIYDIETKTLKNLSGYIEKKECLSFFEDYDSTIAGIRIAPDTSDELEELPFS